MFNLPLNATTVTWGYFVSLTLFRRFMLLTLLCGLTCQGPRAPGRNALPSLVA